MSFLKELARVVDRHRRVLAALAAGICVLALVSATSAAQTPTTTVVVTAHEVTAGTTLAEADLAVRAMRTVDVPDRALTTVADAVGKVTGSAQSRGSVVTEPALVSGRAASAPGRVVMAVKVADADMARLVAPGMRVTLLAPGSSGGLVTDDALVVATPQPAAAGPLGPGSDSRSLIVDVAAATAERLVKLATTSGVTIALH